MCLHRHVAMLTSLTSAITHFRRLAPSTSCRHTTTHLTSSAMVISPITTLCSQMASAWVIRQNLCWHGTWRQTSSRISCIMRFLTIPEPRFRPTFCHIDHSTDILQYDSDTLTILYQAQTPHAHAHRVPNRLQPRLKIPLSRKTPYFSTQSPADLGAKSLFSKNLFFLLSSLSTFCCAPVSWLHKFGIENTSLKILSPMIFLLSLFLETCSFGSSGQSCSTMYVLFLLS